MLVVSAPPLPPPTRSAQPRPRKLLARREKRRLGVCDLCSTGGTIVYKKVCVQQTAASLKSQMCFSCYANTNCGTNRALGTTKGTWCYYSVTGGKARRRTCNWAVHQWGGWKSAHCHYAYNYVTVADTCTNEEDSCSCPNCRAGTYGAGGQNCLPCGVGHYCGVVEIADVL